MDSTHPLVSKSSNPCTNPLVTVPSAPITISITVTFMFGSCLGFFGGFFLGGVVFFFFVLFFDKD